MLDDLRFGFRRVLRAPASSLAIVAILAAGIGATGAMVSVLDALVYRPLSLPDPDALVSISARDARQLPRLMPLITIDHLHAAELPVDGWCGQNRTIEPTVPGDGRAWVGLLTADCFRVFGVAPILGRGFEARETPLTGAGSPVAVISHSFWQRVFGGEPDVLGRTLIVDSTTMTIVGVMPEGFAGWSKDNPTDVYVPFNAHRTATGSPDFIGRLRPGASVETLRPQVQTMWPALMETVWPEGPTRTQAVAEFTGEVESYASGRSILQRLYGGPARIMAGLSALLLLLASVNVAGLLVARVAASAPEIAMMRALGAGPLRIAKQLIAECTALVLGGCVLGVPLAYAASAAFVALLPWGNSPWGITLTPDHRVLAALMLVAVTLVCAIGALPVRLALGGRRVADSARTVAQSGGRLGQVMLVAQVATTVVLVFGAGLIVQSLNALLSTDRGFASTRVLSLRLNATAGGQSRLDQTAYYPALVERLAALPGVESVGFARFFGTINARLTPQPVVFAGETEGTAAGVMEYISPDFFTTLGVPLHAGRDVAWRDLPDSPRVAIVSASLARALDPDGDVVGRRVRYGTAAAAEPMEIVGVVGDVSLGNYRETSVPLLYVPAIQVGEARFLTVHLRTSGPPLALAPAAGAAVASLGREQVGLAATLDFLFTNSIVAERMAAVVSTASAVLALVLSCLGLYALLAHAVTRRTREMGIRIAVGATAGQVARLVMGQGVRLVGVGLALGVPLAILMARWVESLLHGVAATDRTALAVCAVLILLTALVASSLPARRAARIEPADALRAE
jgi:predicted permease